MARALQWSAAEDDYISRRYATDSDDSIGHHLGRKAEAVCKRRAVLGFLRSRLPKDCPAQKKMTDPSPEEIAAMCAKLRRRWTEIDYYNRAKWAGNHPVETTEYRVKGKANGQIVIGNPSNAP